MHTSIPIFVVTAALGALLPMPGAAQAVVLLHAVGTEAFEHGDWGPFVGKASFYQLQYGDYLIGMSCSDAKTYELKVPGVTQTSLTWFRASPFPRLAR